ncbi:MAG: FAD-dependent oxidoreductase, partial [Bacilli bacterium]
MEKQDNEILWEGKPVRDGTKPLRKKIVKVAKMIGGPTGIINKIDANAPEYYSLAGSVSDEECDLLLAMGLRRLRTNEYLAKKLNWTIEKVNEVTDHLGELGVISVNYHEDGTRDFKLPIFAPGLLEIMVVSPNAKNHPEIRRAFNQYTHDRLQSMATMIPQGYGLMRVIPIERALPKGEPVDERDTLKYYLDKFDYYSVGACSCRTCRTEMGEGCGHMPEDRCIKLGNAAKFFVRTGKDRQISREECEAILRHSEDVGLMHSIPNIEGLDKGNTTAICNCCGCACFGLRPAEEFHINDAVASNYRCEINGDNCVACGKCVENCPVNAIKLGTKLPMINEIKVNLAKSLSNHTMKACGSLNPDYRYKRTEVIEETGTAPCKTWCPAHIGVQGYIRLAAQGKYKEALELIKHENPFPAVCGRICPHNCETHCSRSCVDNAVAIDDVKKFIAEQELKPETRFIPAKRYDYSDKKIAIIGAGPAGLSCAYYLAQDGYDITVFEKNKKLGGMMTLGIPAFRLQKDVVEAEIDVIKQLGVKFKTGVEVGKDITIPELRKQ